jgi:hypothetical protein
VYRPTRLVLLHTARREFHALVNQLNVVVGVARKANVGRVERGREVSLNRSRVIRRPTALAPASWWCHALSLRTLRTCRCLLYCSPSAFINVLSGFPPTESLICRLVDSDRRVKHLLQSSRVASPYEYSSISFLTHWGQPKVDGRQYSIAAFICQKTKSSERGAF